jgi:uncharacterized protein YoxC
MYTYQYIIDIRKSNRPIEEKLDMLVRAVADLCTEVADLEHKLKDVENTADDALRKARQQW